MDFLTTARLLMNMRADHPFLRYSFEQTWEGSELVIRLGIDQDVPQMFKDAERLFEAAD